MLVRVKLASGSKKGARSGEGGKRDVCSLALTSAGEGFAQLPHRTQGQPPRSPELPASGHSPVQGRSLTN